VGSDETFFLKRVQMSTPHIEYLSLGKTDSIRQDATANNWGQMKLIILTRE
jgi:hypothetical protein